ncbi:hypothetical protein HYS50_01245 [Candidatus Woesearchaeota archaeon]|nr:hypothetical protein [Candidatus Woesearchaeota archaeon]
MTHYLFILGRNPNLSILEIVAYCRRKKINYNVLDHNEDIALLNLQGFDEHQAIKDLGGTLKIGRPLDEKMIYRGTKNKIVYAINYYKADPSQVDRKIKTLLNKEELKATRRHGKSRNIMPSQARTLDLEFLAYRDKIFMTTAVSNPKEYKQRDANRPAYDPLKVISIRLAKILINLAEPQQEIFDLFCGYGTILQEALLMGFIAMGLDKESQYAKKNMEWLEKQYPKVKGKWQVFQGDATDLRQFKTFETVVTEPYLGPFYRGYPSKQEAEKIAKELESLYKRTLIELAKKVTGKIVIIIPELKTREKENIKIEFSTILKRAGFYPVSPYQKIKIPIAYFDKKDKINRYIYVLEKRK